MSFEDPLVTKPPSAHRSVYVYCTVRDAYARTPRDRAIDGSDLLSSPLQRQGLAATPTSSEPPFFEPHLPELVGAFQSLLRLEEWRLPSYKRKFTYLLHAAVQLAAP